MATRTPYQLRKQLALSLYVPRFRKWLERQRGPYSYCSHNDCPIARYVRTTLRLPQHRVSIGPFEASVQIARSIEEVTVHIPLALHQALNPGVGYGNEHTFQAAYQRLIKRAYRRA